MKAFVIDVNHCNGCYSCQIACKDEHVGNDWSPIAAPQPNIGQFWGKIHEAFRGNIPHVIKTYMFVPCQHCKDAPCINACPIEGALYQRPDGLVIIDSEKCTGCKSCLAACPYSVIYFNNSLNIAQKCTGCAHLLEKNVSFGPRCVDACCFDTIKFGEESELDLDGTETLHSEYGLTTRVHYKNLPKKFVAGTVYDPNTKTIIEGASCTLTGSAGTFTATTDSFGDFWIKGLPDGQFTLTITSSGKTYTADVSTEEKDIGLGNIALV